MTLRIFLTRTSLCAALPVVYAASKNEEDVIRRPQPMRPSELPIYETPHADYKKFVETKRQEEVGPGLIATALETPVKAVRESVVSVVEQTEAFTSTGKAHLEQFSNRSSWLVNYLREDANKDQRYGAVAMGGLTGFIFGLRGGIITKVVYTGLGTLTMGYICFPEETGNVLKDAAVRGEHYANVAYNFVTGVKPGESNEISLTSFNKSAEELKAMFSNMGKTIKDKVSPPSKAD